MSGIRAELAIDDLAGCPVAEASTGSDGPVREVRWSDTGDGTVEQFALGGELENGDFEEVFAYGDRTVYEFERDPAEPCFCESIEERLGPVSEVIARDGTLHVSVHAGDVDALRDLVGDLSSTFGDVRLEYLVQTGTEESEAEVIPVDLDRLTDRQREVLITAFEMGYFEYPRQSNATAVASELGIEPSTFSEHLTVAQGKLFGELLERSS